MIEYYEAKEKRQTIFVGTKAKSLNLHLYCHTRNGQ